MMWPAPASPDVGGIESFAIEPATAAVGYANGDIDLFCLETGKHLLHLTAVHSSWSWLNCLQLRPGVLVSGSSARTIPTRVRSCALSSSSSS
jgi:hypothetical protein